MTDTKTIKKSGLEKSPESTTTNGISMITIMTNPICPSIDTNDTFYNLKHQILRQNARLNSTLQHAKNKKAIESRRLAYGVNHLRQESPLSNARSYVSSGFRIGSQSLNNNLTEPNNRSINTITCSQNTTVTILTEDENSLTGLQQRSKALYDINSNSGGGNNHHNKNNSIKHKPMILTGKARIKRNHKSNNENLHKTIGNNKNVLKPIECSRNASVELVCEKSAYQFKSKIAENLNIENLPDLKSKNQGNELLSIDSTKYEDYMNTQECGKYVIKNSLLLTKMDESPPTKRKIELPQISILPDIDLRKKDMTLQQSPDKIFKFPVFFKRNILGRAIIPRKSYSSKNSDINHCTNRNGNLDSERSIYYYHSVKGKNSALNSAENTRKIRQENGNNVLNWEKRPKLMKFPLKELFCHPTSPLDNQNHQLTLRTGRYSHENGNKEDETLLLGNNSNIEAMNSTTFMTCDIPIINGINNKVIIAQSKNTIDVEHFNSIKTDLKMTNPEIMNNTMIMMKGDIGDYDNGGGHGNHNTSGDSNKSYENTTIKFRLRESSKLATEKMDDVLKRYFTINFTDTMIKKNQKELTYGKSNLKG